MIVLVGHEKGGTGKSTTAVNLAVARAMELGDPNSVLLVDTDKQESATIWSEIRKENEVQPVITHVAKRGKCGYDIAMLAQKYDTVIVDAGGRDSLELRQVMVVCDKMIIPMRPGQFETWTLDSMVRLINEVEEKTEVRTKAFALLNAVSSNPSIKEAEEVREVLQDYVEYFPTLETAIVDRIAYRRAVREGKGVLELSGEVKDPKAIIEFRNFYKEVFAA